MFRPHAEFALALHQELTRDLPAGANLPWSPYSVASALGLAAAGARGRTHEELAQVLAPRGDLAALGRVLAGAADLADAEAAVANTFWMDAHLPFHDAYQQTVLEWPGGARHAVDFRGDPEGSRQKINDDVEQTTRGLVRDLLAAGVITPDTAAVIVNALYLKVAWRHAFVAAATVPAGFHAPSGKRDVPTMRQQETFRYAATGGWRMLTLPTTSDVVVDLLLPDREAPDREGTGLTVDTLAALQESGRMTKVDLAVPRFRVEAAAVLNGCLGRLGIVAAFTRRLADFSGITTAEVFVDSVVHKAVVRVDEQGFEGAAATAVVMALTSMDLSRPVPFHVDRPFLMLVRHRHTGAIYFLARVAEP
jgi:serpin B